MMLDIGHERLCKQLRTEPLCFVCAADDVLMPAAAAFHDDIGLRSMCEDHALKLGVEFRKLL